MTRLRQEASARPGATIYILPIVARVSPGNPDWREQYDRQCAALCEALREPPARTRPILISKTLTDKQLIDGHRPAQEPERNL